MIGNIKQPVFEILVALSLFCECKRKQILLTALIVISLLFVFPVIVPVIAEGTTDENAICGTPEYDAEDYQRSKVTDRGLLPSCTCSKSTYEVDEPIMCTALFKNDGLWDQDYYIKIWLYNPYENVKMYDRFEGHIKRGEVKRIPMYYAPPDDGWELGWSRFCFQVFGDFEKMPAPHCCVFEVVPSEKPDLKITDIWSEDSTIYYKIKNIGNKIAGPSNTNLTIDNVFKAWDYVASLESWEERTESFNYTWDCTGTSDTIKVCADYSDGVEESDEENNCLRETWSCADIWVSPTSFDVTLPPDVVFNYTFTIGNKGTGALEFYIWDVREAKLVAAESKKAPLSQLESIGAESGAFLNALFLYVYIEQFWNAILPKVSAVEIEEVAECPSVDKIWLDGKLKLAADAYRKADEGCFEDKGKISYNIASSSSEEEKKNQTSADYNQTMNETSIDKTKPIWVNQGQNASTIDGGVSVLLYANDTSNNRNVTDTITFTVDDMTQPMVIFMPPTPENNSELTVDYVSINVSVSENVSVALLNWSGTNITMNGSGTNFWLNMTNLSIGNYTYRLYANDTAGNIGVSETRKVTVNVAVKDTTPPASITNLSHIRTVDIIGNINETWVNDTAYVNIAVVIETKKEEKEKIRSASTIIVPDDYPTIQQAVDNASDGDTISVRSGAYHENIRIDNKDLTIEGEARDTTIIDGGGSGDCVRVSSADVNIKGFTIKNAGNYDDGVYAYSSDLNIDNATIMGCGKDAIHFRYGKSLTVRDSILENCDAGLYYYSTAAGNATIEGNLIQNTTGNGLYIKLASGKSAAINNNMIINNTGSDSDGIYCSISGGGGLVTMKNNTVNSSGDDGIHLSGAKYSTMVNNTISSNSGYGICLYSPNSNLIFHNNLINNSRSNAYDSNPASNDWYHPVLREGNYWSDYTGADNGSGTEKHGIVGDGIGDTNIPHPGPNYDYYPFVNESGWTLPKLNIIHTHTDKIAYGLNKTVTISCIVQNDTKVNISVDNLNVKIIKPDNSIAWITLFEGLVGNYNGIFTNTSLFGAYDVTIYAYKSGLLTDTAKLSFEVLPDHDIAVTNMDAPSSTEVNSIIIVNATISNIGLNNESNITVDFIVDGVNQSYTTIDSLKSRSYTNVSFQWTAPGIAGRRHNIMICAEYVVNETIVWNNKLSKIITIGDIWVPDNYTTIQQAVNNAIAGDTIIVRDGTYTENVDVNKSLTILAENESALTIVQAANSSDHVFEVTADYVNISGFTVTGTDYAGIYLYNVDRCNISDNNASNNDYGIYLNSSSNCTLTSNTANSNRGIGGYKRDGYGYGIYLVYSSDCTLTSNTANSNSGTGFRNYDGYGYGIYLVYSSDCALTSNTANSNSGAGGEGHDPYESFGGDGNGYGIYLYSSSNCKLTSNTANSNSGTGGRGESANDWNEWFGGRGGDGYCDGIFLYSSSNCKLTNNTAYSSIGRGGSGGYGIHDADGGDGGDGDGDGIYLSSSSNCTLISNTVNSNYGSGGRGGSGGVGSGASDGSDGYGYGDGIFMYSSSNNTIYNNYFSNTNNAWDDGNNIWNINKTQGTNIIGGPYLGGNYWSDYIGIDKDGDELGDTLLPYHASGDITTGGDYLPLVPVSAVQFETELESGWNLISVPLNLTTWELGNESEVGDPLNVTPKNSLTSIYRYSITLDLFEKCDHFDDFGWWPATGSESFTELEPGRGYWVMAKNDCNLTFTGTAPSDLNVTLNNGWNLIGWYSMEEALLGQEAVVGDPLNVTPKNSLTAIYWYNSSTGSFDKCDHFDDWGWWPATGSESFTELEPGRGYWVMAKNDCVWRHKA